MSSSWRNDQPVPRFGWQRLKGTRPGMECATQSPNKCKFGRSRLNFGRHRHIMVKFGPTLAEFSHFFAKSRGTFGRSLSDFGPARTGCTACQTGTLVRFRMLVQARIRDQTGTTPPCRFFGWSPISPTHGRRGRTSAEGGRARATCGKTWSTLGRLLPNSVHI